MKQSRASKVVVQAGALLLLLSCASKHEQDKVESPALPAAFSTSQGPTSPAVDNNFASWWKALGSDVLAALVEEGLKVNFEVAMAIARVEQSRARAEGAGAELMPQVGVTGSVTRSRASIEDPAVEKAESSPGFERTSTVFKVAPQVSWEIDLFGRKRALREAAVTQQWAVDADAQAIKLVVASEIAKGVLRAQTLQERSKLASQAAKTEAEFAEVLAAKRMGGFASEADILRAQAIAFESQAGLARLSAEYTNQVASLASLLASEPTVLRKRLESLGPISAFSFEIKNAGQPADLLRRRPDIKRAEFGVMGARHRKSAAKRQRFPTLNILGTLGLAAGSVASLGTSGAVFAAVGPSIGWNALDFGRISAEIENAEGEEKEVYLKYQATVKAAFIESETALWLLAERDLVIKRSKMALNSYEKSWDIIKTQFDKGLIDSTPTFETRQALTRAQDALAVAQEAKGLAVIQTYLALGGGF